MSESRPRAYIDRLHEAVAAKGAPLVLGLDPHRERIPRVFHPRAPRVGERRALARTYQRWAEAILPAAAPYVAGVKIQVAFYEEAGWAGLWALERAAALARELGLLVILDVKRGDVPSTAAAYARAWLDGPTGADAVTLHPWLGSDSLAPFLERVRDGGRGLYLLVLTSNPGAAELQAAPAGPGGEPLYRLLARRVAAWADRPNTGAAWSSVGAVVGATHPRRLAGLRRLMPRVPFLLPGVGAQGGQVESLACAFGSDPARPGAGAVVAASRSLLFGVGAEEIDRPAGEVARGVARRARALRDRVAAVACGSRKEARFTDGSDACAR